MDPSAPAYRGQSDYTRPLLRAYDRVVLGFVAWFSLALPERVSSSSGTGSASGRRISTSAPIGSVAIFAAWNPRPGPG